MSSYVVLARRYRPQKFADLVGQEHVSVTLRNAVLQARTAHAYLFTGPRGVGKTSAARILAKAIRCLELTPQGEPCNQCIACTSVNDGNSLDVIEIDAASNTGVDNIRDLRSNVEFMASIGKYRVYIIDEVHMLSTAAFNALLKTLEEPPPHVVFIFATTELHKVLPTIQSRCQRFDFKRISPPVMREKLLEIAKHEKIEIDTASLNSLVEESEGCMRDAESLLDQAISLCGKKIEIGFLSKALSLLDRGAFFKLLRSIGNHDPAQTLKLCTDMFERGLDPKILLNRLADFYSDLHYRTFTHESRVPDLERDQVMDELIGKLSVDEIIRGLDICIKTQSAFNSALNSMMAVESLLVKLCLQRPALTQGQAFSKSEIYPTAQQERVHTPAQTSTPLPKTDLTSRVTTPAAPTQQQNVGTANPELRSVLESYIRTQKPAWSPVLQSILGIEKDSSVEGSVIKVKVKADFAGKRLASSDGAEILKKAFAVARTQVDFDSTNGPGANPGKPIEAEDPRAKAQKKAQLAKEHDAVKAALEIFDGVITETKVLEDEKPSTRQKGPDLTI
jgi:DNA polymerase-3 subunit gamma/tau